MRRVNPLPFLVWFFVAAVVRAGDFETANRLFDEGKFGEAKGAYEQLVGRGAWSANLFYNLGNTEFRLGAPGEAALNYERALALENTHPEALANLKWVRGKSGAKVSEPRWWEHAFPPLSGNAFAMIAALAAWVAVFALAAPLLGRRAWGTAFVAVLLTAYAGAGLWLRDRDRTAAVIIAKEAPARLAPADRAALAETLPAGSRVRVLSERGEWIYCALPSGGLGWIAAPQLARIRLGRS